MRPIRILLVEDEPSDILLTRRALSQAQMRLDLLIARDADEALDHLHQRGRFSDAVRPDLVLLDLGLPGADGLSVLRAIKSTPAFNEIPVVVLTGSESDPLIAEAYASRANSCVRKPDDLPAYVKIIDDISHFWFNVVRLQR